MTPNRTEPNEAQGQRAGEINIREVQRELSQCEGMLIDAIARRDQAQRSIYMWEGDIKKLEEMLEELKGADKPCPTKPE